MPRISFDNRAITIDGNREFLISGAIHYPRSTPAMWPEMMKASKAAGLNCIETYVFWNLHEKERGVYDFSDRLNIRRFCEVAQEEGLHVILRIGPYICAETNFGGLPPWLCEIEGLRTRTWNQPFMDEMERWVLALTDYIRPLLVDNGGPIILSQFENEYNGIAGSYGEAGQRYVQWAVELGQRLKLDIPLIMCEGAAPGALETINGFVGAERIPAQRKKHPEQPALWTENWTGWYNTWGYQRHFRLKEEIAYRLVHFIAAGGTGFNYYMWHAGTNFGRESMYLQTTEYGFAAPLDECGKETTLSRYLGKIHHLLHENAHIILASRNPECQSLGESIEAYELSAGDERLSFLCNTCEDESHTVTWEGHEVALKPWSVQIFKNGILVLDTTAVEVDPVRGGYQAVNGIISGITSWQEPLPRDWPARLASPQVFDKPVNQLPLTKDRTDYCWYSTEIDVGNSESGEGVFAVNGAGDFLHVYVDGRCAACSSTPLAENRVLNIKGKSGWGGPEAYVKAEEDGEGERADKVHFREKFQLDLTPGKHRIDILCTALGLIKGDWMLGYTNMVFERKGIWGEVTWRGRPLTAPWTLQTGLVGERCRLFADAAARVDWRPDTTDAMRWIKVEFARPESPEALMLDLQGMNKGMIWLNGKCAGRYWLVKATTRNPTSPQKSDGKNWPSAVITDGEGEPTQRYYHLPAEWLEETNTLILFEEGGGKTKKIRICARRAESLPAKI